MAGLRVDGTGWVRPIAPQTDHGQLYAPHYRLNDGTDAGVLDVVRIDLAARRPQPGQPENRVIGKQPWVLISRPAGRNLDNVLWAALDHGPSLLGSLDGRIPANAADQARASLTLAVPSLTAWFIERDIHGGFQPRVLIELNGQSYNLPVTDPAWTSLIVRKLSRLQGATHPQAAIGIAPDSRVLLTQLSQLGTSETGSAFVFNTGIPKVSTTF